MKLHKYYIPILCNIYYYRNMCCIPYYLLWWSLAGTMMIGANHWVIVKIHVNGTTKWEDGTKFPPIDNLFTINITRTNNTTNTNMQWSDEESELWGADLNNDLNRDLLIPFDDHVEYITHVNATTIYIPKKPIWNHNHVDEILIGHIVFFAIIDIIAIMSIVLIGINYVKLWNNQVDYSRQDDEEEDEEENLIL